MRFFTGNANRAPSMAPDTGPGSIGASATPSSTSWENAWPPSRRPTSMRFGSACAVPATRTMGKASLFTSTSVARAVDDGADDDWEDEAGARLAEQARRVVADDAEVVAALHAVRAHACRARQAVDVRRAGLPDA